MAAESGMKEVSLSISLEYRYATVWENAPRE
jgi:hypothetical protein